MDELERLLAKRYWQPYCLRTGIAQPEYIVEKNGFRKAQVASNTPRPREVSLLRAIRAVAPDWCAATKVIINKDVTCRRQSDGANLGSSYILFLGDFEGGALVFDDGTRFEAKREWFEFDGQVPHWNEPHTWYCIGPRWLRATQRRASSGRGGWMSPEGKIRDAVALEPQGPISGIPL